MKKQVILVVEDDLIIRSFLVKKFKKFGRVFEAGNLSKALEILKVSKIDIAFIDLNLSMDVAEEGLIIIAECVKRNIEPIVLSSFNEQEVIDRAFKIGAKHYFTKENISDHFDSIVGKFLNKYSDDSMDMFFKNEFITINKKLQESIKFLISQSNIYDQKILLTGETGVGKTLIAKLIHKLSVNNEVNRPFVEKNLNEITPSIFEAELFGYKKGAFTGAINDKKGLLEEANGGTLFLDEIGALPVDLQQKLLKVIEEKKFTPLGTTKEIKTDFKLITATCDNIKEKITNGEFRIDFYFRIKGLEINIPSLKERRDDILPILFHFLKIHPKKLSLDENALIAIQKYDWIGNIRELKSFSLELLSLDCGIIKKENLPSYILNPSQIKDYKKMLSDSNIDFLKKFGLPALIKEIEKESLVYFKARIGDKTNKLIDNLRISKSVFYRINEENNNEKTSISS